jgi:hypothetical protein
MESTYTDGVCLSNTLADFYQDSSLSEGQIGMSAGYLPTSDPTIPVIIAFDDVLIVDPSFDDPLAGSGGRLQEPPTQPPDR